MNSKGLDALIYLLEILLHFSLLCSDLLILDLSHSFIVIYIEHFNVRCFAQFTVMLLDLINATIQVLGVIRFRFSAVAAVVCA